MDACIVALANEPDDKRTDFTKQLELFKKAGSSLYTLTKLMKQQDKLDPDKFIDAVAQFLIDLEIPFLGYKYYNKLHFLSLHVIEFVIEYHWYGRLSVEGHKSQHARTRKSMELLRHMETNNDSRFGKHMSRQMLGLNSDVVQQKGKLLNAGKEPGKYNVALKSVVLSTCEVTCDSNIERDGKMYFKFACDTGIISYQCKDISLYLIKNTMLPSWSNEKSYDIMKEHTYKQSINSGFI